MPAGRGHKATLSADKIISFSSTQEPGKPPPGSCAFNPETLIVPGYTGKVWGNDAGTFPLGGSFHHKRDYQGGSCVFLVENVNGGRKNMLTLVILIISLIAVFAVDIAQKRRSFVDDDE